MSRANSLIRSIGLAIVLIGGLSAPLLAGSPKPARPPAAQLTARDRLDAHLHRLLLADLAERRREIAQIANEQQAMLRQARVRALISDLVQPLNVRGPVRFEVTGRAQAEGYRVDNLWFESLPNYRVTANLYTPNGRSGPLPAILLQPGHDATGRRSDHAMAVNFVRAGYIVLAIDIVGMGERGQYYDAETGTSPVGRPTGEHSMAFGQALPVGGHVSRFFIQDAVRAIDLLVARPDVDPDRIGAIGCSGGGTMTAYLAAFDPRVHAMAVACWINDYAHMLGQDGPGPQEAEQTIAFFAQRGLDMPDWIELAAPLPYAVVATTQDMFPIAGARAAYAEARRFYAAMGASDRITLIEGPGEHCNLAPIAPKIIGFFNRWLQGRDDEPAYEEVPIGDPTRLFATPTGQLITSDGGERLQAVIARDLTTLPIVRYNSSAAGRQRLREAVRSVTRVQTAPGNAPPTVRAGESENRSNYTMHDIEFAAEPGLVSRGLFARTQAGGRRPTLLLLSSQPLATLSSNGGLFEQWTRAGWNVLALEPTGAGGTEEAKSPLPVIGR